jgi:hypothetical protein
MNYMTAPAPTLGRDQTCEQCGSVYKAQRSTSRFCGDTCKKRGQRGVDPRADEIMLKRLTAMGMVGKIGPVNSRDPRPARYGLTVPRSYALAELNDRYNRPTVIALATASMTLKEALAIRPEKAQPDIGEAAFAAALDRLEIQAF